MDLSLGTTPQGDPGSTLTTPTPQGTTTTTTTTTTTQVGTQTPLVEQPIADQISQSTAPAVQVQVTYAATAQLPVLPKPVETPKSETHKGDTHKASGHVPADQQQSSPTLEEPGHTHQQGQEQQQGGGEGGGGGQQGGGQGSDSSGSGSSSSGDGQQSGHKGGQTAGITAGASVTADLDVNTDTDGTDVQAAATITTTAATTATTGTESTQTAKIDPLKDATVISALGMFSPPVNPAQFFDNGQKMMNEIYQANVKFAATMPDGPDKFRFIDFLKLVQTALSQFQQLLRQIQVDDSQAARSRTKAQLETTLAKIDESRKQQAEIDKKNTEAANKMKIMGPLMAIFAFVMVIILAAILVLTAVTMLCSGPAGWMALSMIVCEFVDQCAQVGGQKPFLMQKFVDALAKYSDAIVESATHTFHLTPAEEARGKAIAKTILISVSMAFALAIAPAAFVFGGFNSLISFLTDSHIIRDMQTQSGASEEQANKVEMFVTLGISMAFIVAAFAAAFVMPPSIGEGIAVALGKVSETIGAVSLKIARAVKDAVKYFFDISDAASAAIVRRMETMMKVILDPEIWVSHTQFALQTTQSVSTYRYQTLLADIALIHGRLDSEMEDYTTTITILKKMIKQLLESLAETGKQITNIGDMIHRTNANISNISTNIFA